MQRLNMCIWRQQWEQYTRRQDWPVHSCGCPYGWPVHLEPMETHPVVGNHVVPWSHCCCVWLGSNCEDGATHQCHLNGDKAVVLTHTWKSFHYCGNLQQFSSLSSSQCTQWDIVDRAIRPKPGDDCHAVKNCSDGLIASLQHNWKAAHGEIQ